MLPPQQYGYLWKIKLNFGWASRIPVSGSGKSGFFEKIRNFFFGLYGLLVTSGMTPDGVRTPRTSQDPPEVPKVLEGTLSF